MKINELKPGAGIEIMAEIISIQPVRRLWKFFENRKPIADGLAKTDEEYMEVLKMYGAESKFPGVGLWVQEVTSALVKDDTGSVYLDLWKDDIKRFRIGERIHIVDGYARQNSSGGVNLSKGKYGYLFKMDENWKDIK